MFCLVTGRNASYLFGAIRIVPLILAAGCFLAGLLDAVENIALIQVLFGNPSATWPGVARVAALVKFGLLGVAVVGIIIQLIGRVFSRNR